MPRNGSGTYSLPQPAFVPGTTISSSAVNSDFSDIATALSQSISSDGQTTITGQLKFPSGTSSQPGITFGTDLTTGLYYIGTKQLGVTAGGVSALVVNTNNLGSGQNGNILQYGTGAYPSPVGMVVDFAGSSSPAGWFLCSGQAISRTTYAELFFVIGTTYGTGDGSTTFNVPDLRGRASFGKDNMGGTPANRITVAGGNFDGTVLGGSGGAQNNTAATNVTTSATLVAGNIPQVSTSYTPAGTNSGTQSFGTVIQANGLGSNVNAQGSGVPWANTLTVNFANAIFAGTPATITVGNASPTAVSASGSGTSSSFSILSPALIMNKIIFAGRN